MLHNLRSSLDSFAFDVLDGHELPESQQRRLQFSITASAETFEAGRWHTGSIDDATLRAFKHVQPWAWLAHDLNEEQRHRVVANDPLSRLNRLSNTDKHRSLHVMVTALRDVWWGLDAEGTHVELAEVAPLPWQNGTRIARIRLTGRNPTQTPSFGRSFTIALEDDADPRTPDMAAG